MKVHLIDGTFELFRCFHGAPRFELSDGREFTAEVVGADAKTDIAVLKIESNGLKPAAWGDSEAIKVGEWVLAVGSPFGLDQTVTAGIVSAKGRADVGLGDSRHGGTAGEVASGHRSPLLEAWTLRLETRCGDAAVFTEIR